MKVVSVEQMQELDRRTIEEFGTAGEVLMERAGMGVVRVVRALLDRRGLWERSVRCYAGKGNNGGDAFVAARLLKEQGIDTEVYLAGRHDDVSGDARIHFDRMVDAGVSFDERPDPERWGEGDLERVGILVDGLLGTGTSGAPRGPVLSAIREINEASSSALVVAIDTPSGLDADTGKTPGERGVAEVTVTRENRPIVRRDRFRKPLSDVVVAFTSTFTLESSFPDIALDRRPGSAPRGHRESGSGIIPSLRPAVSR